MPDPTEFVIIATFSLAFGIFALTATARKLVERKLEPALASDPLPFAEDSPYLSPAIGELPPPLPDGRVPVWFYRPLDLLGIGTVFLLFFSLIVTSVSEAESDVTALTPDGLIASIGFQFILAVLVTATVIGRVRPIEWLGLRWTSWRWVFLIAPGTVLGMWMFFGGLQASGYMQWIESFGVEAVQDTVKILQESSDPLILGLMAFAAVIAAPLCEEIIFRGYLYGAAKRFAGPWAAGISSALIFGAAHGSIAALLPLFVFGCVLAFIYEKTGSLWAPIGVHFCFNGATVLIQMTSRFYDIPPRRHALKTLRDIGEDALIERLVALVPRDKNSAAGPGDDCAVIDHGSPSLLLLKTDALVEHVHFLPDAPARAVGWKAAARVVSDFAAMGGKPEQFLVTLALPPETTVAWAEELYRGIGDCLEKFGGLLAGGETSSVPSGSAAVISIAATGSVRRENLVLRSTGRLGDLLLVTGSLGGSIHGKHLSFTPRLKETGWLVSHFKPTSMMDLSDGLAKDLPRLAIASSCGFRIEESALPITAGCSAAQALGDGEDFEILFSMDPLQAPALLKEWPFHEVPLTPIGELVAAGEGQLLHGGWEHFRF